tara:strand:+ start:22 stop:171 length:150 start_codon:yes stop_codon:yes gene_type:complete
MPYGKGTYGSKVGRPKAKNGKKKPTGAKMSPNRKPKGNLKKFLKGKKKK